MMVAKQGTVHLCIMVANLGTLLPRCHGTKQGPLLYQYQDSPYLCIMVYIAKQVTPNISEAKMVAEAETLLISVS